MDYIFAHKLEARFRDCDPLGHVNNAVYLTYLEQARFAHWRSIWGFGTDHPAPEVPGVILARAEIDYRAPARYGDALEIRIAIAAVGRTSFTYDYQIVNGRGEVIATARTVLVLYDYRTNQPVPIPDSVREMFAVRQG